MLRGVESVGRYACGGCTSPSTLLYWVVVGGITK